MESMVQAAREVSTILGEVAEHAVAQSAQLRALSEALSDPPSQAAPHPTPEPRLAPAAPRMALPR